MKIINTSNAPAAIGPYSQGKESDFIVITSGQLPIDPETNELKEDIKEATKQSMLNCKAVLEKAGSSLEKVIKTTVFMRDLAQFNDFNEVYASFFDGDYPARSCVQVAKLPKDACVEIEMIAIK